MLGMVHGRDFTDGKPRSFMRLSLFFFFGLFKEGIRGRLLLTMYIPQRRNFLFLS